jgi:hypothetical protein
VNIMSHEKTISDLAYHLWQARGCPAGSSEVDWAEAERQVKGRAPESNEQVPAQAALPAADESRTSAEAAVAKPKKAAKR